MSIIYEVTWKRDKNNQNPTDSFPRGVQVEDFELQSLTPRREVWRYELGDEGDARYLESQLNSTVPCISYRRMSRGQVR